MTSLSPKSHYQAKALAQQRVDRHRMYEEGDFWEWCKYVKTRDEEKGDVSTVPRWEFLRRIERETEAHRLNVICKPRQMFISNLMCLKRLHRALCADEGRDQVYFGIIISKREDDAKELMNRIQFMYQSLPDWLKVPLKQKTTSELLTSKGGRILCLPASATIGHTFTATDLLLDEWSRLPFDREIHAGIMPTIGRRGRVDGVSTPNGPFNLFADIWHSEDPAWNKVTLDWWEHPDRDEEWKKEEIKKLCPDPNDLSLWKQQYEREFEVFSEKAVYPGFASEHIDNKMTFVPRETLYRGWDFGGHVAAVVFFQVVDRQIRFLRELIVTDQTISKASSVFVNPDNNIDDLATAVLNRTREWFGPDAGVRDFCDPQGAHVSDLSRRSQRSRIDVLNTYGIYPEYRFANISEGVEIIRMRMRVRPDGEYGLMISQEGCPVLTTGFQGGISRRPPAPGKAMNPTEDVLKDGWFEHIHDAARYGVTGVFRTTEKPQTSRRPRRSIRHNVLTGVPGG